MQSFILDKTRSWVPEIDPAFKAHYKLGRYDNEQILNTMWKYLVRSANCERAWVRINMHLPETITTDEKLKILEFSTAHGGMLEIWRSYGHEVRGTDYAWAVEGSGKVHKGIRKKWHTELLNALKLDEHDGVKNDPIAGWPYQAIIESLGLDVDLFDGGALPYKYEDKSFDVICCYQAIEAYAHPDKWLDIVAEFCRIACKTVVLGFNPPPIGKMDDDDYIQATHEAWLALQHYNQHGFRSVFFEIGETRRGIHPTAVKLMAL